MRQDALDVLTTELDLMTAVTDWRYDQFVGKFLGK